MTLPRPLAKYKNKSENGIEGTKLQMIDFLVSKTILTTLNIVFWYAPSLFQPQRFENKNIEIDSVHWPHHSSLCKQTRIKNNNKK